MTDDHGTLHTPSKPTGAAHALFTGWCVGSAMKAGLNPRPIVDDDGDYTDTFTIELPDIPNVRLSIVVPVPDPDWVPSV